MAYMGLSRRASVQPASLSDLVKGKATIGISHALGTRVSDVQSFIDGKATIGLAKIVGIQVSELQGFRNDIDRQGAIGFIVGILTASDL